MDALTPDLAEKVLTADVRNLIKKVSDGGTLSASARALFHTAALLPGLSNQARVAALFKKWAAGGRLGPDELAELHAWSAHEPTPEVPPAPPAATPEPALEASPVPDRPTIPLDSPGPRFVGPRVKYPETLAVYSALYGSDERTLKRYIANGRAADPPDLPPLHRPSDMPAWFARRMRNRVPPGILLAASQAAPPPAPEPPPAEAPAAPAAAPPSHPRDYANIETLNFEEHVEQLRRSLAITSRLLDEAREGTDEGVKTSRQRDYRETSAELRKAENDLIAWQQQREILVLKADVRAENSRIATSIFTAVWRMMKNIRPKMAGKSEAEQNKLWEDETLRCFVSLRDAQFTDHAAVVSSAA